MPKVTRERVLSPAEAVTIFNARGVRQQAEARCAELDAEVARLSEKVDDLLNAHERIQAECAERVAQLVGYCNAGEGPAIPADLAGVKQEGPEDALRLTWEEDEPAAPAVKAEPLEAEPASETSSLPEAPQAKPEAITA